MSYWQMSFCMGKCLMGKRLMGKCPSGPMSFWAKVFWANVFLGKCPSGQTSSGQMSFWANVSGQISLSKRRMGKCRLFVLYVPALFILLMSMSMLALLSIPITASPSCSLTSFSKMTSSGNLTLFLPGLFLANTLARRDIFRSRLFVDGVSSSSTHSDQSS
jgi:hypothetical protein